MHATKPRHENSELQAQAPQTRGTLTTDLVFPRGNEEHLVQMARKLGIRHLIFCYTLRDPLLKDRAKEVAMLAAEEQGFTTEFAVLVTSQQDVMKAKNVTRTVIGIARPELFDDKRISHIIDMESGRRDDFIHHRNSGLNQVFIEQAKRSEKTLLVDASQALDGRTPMPVIIGRMQQNNQFFRKYNPRVIVVSGASEPLEMRAPKDLAQLLRL